MKFKVAQIDWMTPCRKQLAENGGIALDFLPFQLFHHLNVTFVPSGPSCNLEIRFHKMQLLIGNIYREAVKIDLPSFLQEYLFKNIHLTNNWTQEEKLATCIHQKPDKNHFYFFELTFSSKFSNWLRIKWSFYFEGSVSAFLKQDYGFSMPYL